MTIVREWDRRKENGGRARGLVDEEKSGLPELRSDILESLGLLRALLIGTSFFSKNRSIGLYKFYSIAVTDTQLTLSDRLQLKITIAT